MAISLLFSYRLWAVPELICDSRFPNDIAFFTELQPVALRTQILPLAII